MKKPRDIIEAIQRKECFGHFVKGKKFAAWIVFLKAIYGLEMTPDEEEIYKNCTGRKPQSGGFQECYCISGRRSGKSSCSALICCWEALFSGQAETLSPGEHGHIFLIATDRKQALIVLSYVRAILENFKDMIEKDLAWDIHLKNQVIISIKPATYRAGRGFSTLGIFLDEIAFFRDESSASPCEEIVSSLLPGLKESGKLFGWSTPYARSGYLFNVFEENFEKDSPILIWKSSTKTMHPDFSQSIIDRLINRRKGDQSIVLRQEFEGNFREDLETFITLEEYQTAVLDGVPQLPAMASNHYKAFVDMSGGKVDSSCLAISHHDDGFATLDLVFEVRSPHNPEDAVRDFVDILKRYRIHEVVGDKYSSNWCQSAYRRKGIVYHESKLDKSTIYQEFQALLAMRKLMLIDNQRLRQQCIGLERRLRSGGKDVIDHAPGYHDDLINAAAGACQLIFETEIATKITPSEMRARMPSIQSTCLYKNQNLERQKQLAAAKEMDALMRADGCSPIYRKRQNF